MTANKIDKAKLIVEAWDNSNYTTEQYTEYISALLYLCTNSFYHYFMYICCPVFGITKLYDYQKEILNLLEKNRFNLIFKLILTMPQQLGKTLLMKCYASYKYTIKSHQSILYISYNDEQSADFLKDLKLIFTSDNHQAIFGKYFKIQETLSDEDNVTTNRKKVTDKAVMLGSVGAEGKLNVGYIRTRSTQQGLGGKKSHLTILDDLVSEPSLTRNNNAINKLTRKFVSTINGRVQFDGAQILITSTRYAVDDIIGELLRIQGYKQEGSHEDGEFTVRIYPARQIDTGSLRFGIYGARPYDKRQVGEWLVPDKTKISSWIISEKLDPDMFNLIYQQMPDLNSSNQFPLDKFKTYHNKPNIDNFIYKYACVDSSNSGKTTSDDSAIIVYGVDNNYDLYILDVKSDKMWENDLIEALQHYNIMYHLDDVFIEAKGIGENVIRRLITEFNITANPLSTENKNKLQRLKEGVTAFNLCNIYIPAPEIDYQVQKMLMQLEKFTGATNDKDDIVDTIGYGFKQYLIMFGSQVIDIPDFNNNYIEGNYEKLQRLIR